MSLSGSVDFGLMEVFEASHAVILHDPQGAAFALWQPKDHIGARIKGETGAVIWNELMTSDAAAATQFYTRLLGMASSKMESPIDYTMLNVCGTELTGVMRIRLYHWAAQYSSHLQTYRTSVGSLDLWTCRVRCSSYSTSRRD